MNIRKYFLKVTPARKLILITLIGLILRIYKISYGLPSISHEEFSTLGNVWAKEQVNNLNPSWFSWPSLLFYIEYIVLKILHFFHILNWIDFVLMSRFVQVIVGALTLPFVYLVSREFYNRQTALLATFLVAIFPQHILYSQLARPEVMVPFFNLIIILSSIFIQKKGGIEFYVLSFIFIGFAISSKYNGIFSLMIPLAAHLFRTKRSRKVNLDLKCFFCLISIPAVVFLITNPYSILDYRTFLNSISYQASRVKFNLSEQIIKTLHIYSETFGPILFGLSAIGLFYTFTKTSKNKLILATFVSSELLILFWNPSVRLLLTSMLVLIIISSNLLTLLLNKITKIYSKYIFASLIFIVSSSFLQRDYILYKELSRKSVTDAVINWFINAPEGSKVYWGYEAPIPYILVNNNRLLFETVGDVEPVVLYDNDYERFKKEDFDYLILSEDHKSLNQYNSPLQYNFYKQLENDYKDKVFRWDRSNNIFYSAPFSQLFRSQTDYLKGSVYIYEKRKGY